MNFSSLPWILGVGVKEGKIFHAIFDINFELQLMNVKFTLSVIIWGDGKSHYVGISVDVNRKKHIYYDGMANRRMVILQHDQSLSSSIGWGHPLQLRYVNKADLTPYAIQGQSKNILPTINVIMQPIGLTNLKSTCYLNALIQMAFSFTLMQRSIMRYSIGSENKLAQGMNKTITFFDDDETVEVSSVQLANGLLQLITLFKQIQVGGDKLTKCMDTRPFVEPLGLSPDIQQMCL